MKLQLISAACLLPLCKAQDTFDNILENESFNDPHDIYDAQKDILDHQDNQSYSTVNEDGYELNDGSSDPPENPEITSDNPVLDGLVGRSGNKDYRVSGIKFVLQEPTRLGIVYRNTGFFTNYRVYIHDGSVVNPVGVTKSTLEGKPDSVLYGNLQPSAIYWITIKATAPDGTDTVPQTIKVHTLPAAAQALRTIDFNERCTTLQWYNPNQVRPQVVCTVRVQNARREWREQTCTGDQQDTVEICDVWPGTSWDLKIWYGLNRKKSNSYVYRFTMQPHPVVAAQASKIVMKDDEKADVAFSWEWPKDNQFWGAVKITYSPPTGDETTTESPYWITDRRVKVRNNLADQYYPAADFTIENLKQGVVYTICVTLTKGPLESVEKCFSQDIPKIKTDALKPGSSQENALEQVKQLTCRVPLHLNPRNLRATKNPFEMDQSMTIKWTHPEKKIPEQGYKVVVAPNVDSSISIPKIYRIQRSAIDDSKPDMEMKVDGPDYDSFVEYSISVVAIHTESATHSNPNGPEFVARIYTGEFERTADGGSLAEQVTPDSCCGNIKFSSETSKQCCSEKLYEPERGEACCGSIVYNKSTHMCCDTGITGAEPKINQMSVGCNFGEELLNTSGTVRGRG